MYYHVRNANKGLPEGNLFSNLPVDLATNFIYVIKEVMNMVNVFDYLDFRAYLSDYYEEMKKQHPQFSYKYFANKAGFKNKGFAYNIFNGNKALSKSNLFKLSAAMGHTAAEMEYFETLVTFNQAQNLDQKRYCFEKLNQVQNKGKKKSTVQTIRNDQYEFYSKWYHAVIRSLIGMYKFADDYAWLARMVDPSITLKQAKQSVHLLEQLALIKKQPDGTFALTDISLTTGETVLSLAVQNFHVECTELAKRALQASSSAQRNITGLTLGISEKTYAAICEKTRQFQQEIMNLADSDESADRVYQFNFHLFPASRIDDKRKNHES